MFGLASPGPALGFSQGGDANGAGGAGGEGGEVSREAVLGPVLDVLSEFRDSVRGCGRAGDTKGVLAACDHVREELLPAVGVRLEDKGDKVRVFCFWADACVVDMAWSTLVVLSSDFAVLCLLPCLLLVC